MYTLELTEQELKAIFDALLERPFKDAFKLIQRLQELYGGEKK